MIVESHFTRVGGRIKTFIKTQTHGYGSPLYLPLSFISLIFFSWFLFLIYSFLSFLFFLFFLRAPFSDHSLYAEAGAMRIPSEHPLVNELIDIENLTSKKRLFFNADVDHMKYVEERQEGQ